MSGKKIGVWVNTLLRNYEFLFGASKCVTSRYTSQNHDTFVANNITVGKVFDAVMETSK
ncbi:hypothetical protein AB6F62_11245 [Providencia huaxiensis]|uniref:hypothetical protein n=1 Tax=Providencia huaxiensis TaxID=2027290 RepID=UPI0034DD3E53